MEEDVPRWTETGTERHKKRESQTETKRERQREIKREGGNQTETETKRQRDTDKGKSPGPYRVPLIEVGVGGECRLLCKGHTLRHRGLFVCGSVLLSTCLK